MHGAQLDDPEELWNCPAPQPMHWLELVRAVFGWYLPASQVLQVEAPAEDWYFPAGQAMHWLALPMLEWNLPVVQGLQLDAPAND